MFTLKEHIYNKMKRQTLMKNSLAEAGIISDPKSFAVGKRHLNQNNTQSLTYTFTIICTILLFLCEIYDKFNGIIDR